jgi:hypothetical protein
VNKVIQLDRDGYNFLADFGAPFFGKRSWERSLHPFDGLGQRPCQLWVCQVKLYGSQRQKCEFSAISGFKCFSWVGGSLHPFDGLLLYRPTSTPVLSLPCQTVRHSEAKTWLSWLIKEEFGKSPFPFDAHYVVMHLRAQYEVYVLHCSTTVHAR